MSLSAEMVTQNEVEQLRRANEMLRNSNTQYLAARAEARREADRQKARAEKAEDMADKYEEALEDCETLLTDPDVRTMADRCSNALICVRLALCDEPSLPPDGAKNV